MVFISDYRLPGQFIDQAFFFVFFLPDITNSPTPASKICVFTTFLLKWQSVLQMKQKKFIIILIFTLAILLAGGFAFFNMSRQHNLRQTIPQTVSPSPATIPGWKQFTNASGYNLGISFSYPDDWKFSEGNAGPIFTSPDQKLVFSIAGPYGDTIESLLKTRFAHDLQTMNIKQSHESLLGHPAVRLETSEKEEIKNSLVSTISVNEYIGNVKHISHWQNGSPDVEYMTLLLGIDIIDKSQHDKATRIFDQILSTIAFVK